MSEWRPVAVSSNSFRCVRPDRQWWPHDTILGDRFSCGCPPTLECGGEPCPSKGPLALYSAWRELQVRRRFIGGEAANEPKLHDTGSARKTVTELGKRTVQPRKCRLKLV